MKKICLSLMFFLIVFSVKVNLTFVAVAEKAYVNVNLDDSFEDDKIMVVLSHEASMVNKKYTINDFPEINCLEVEDLSYPILEMAYKNEVGRFDNEGNLLINNKPFRRIIALHLSKQDKLEVIEGIKILDKRRDVFSAEPSYMNGQCNALPNDSRIGYQWAIDKIQLDDAWDIETGANTVKVGIIDTGIDSSHPELSGRLDTVLSSDFTTDDPVELPFVDRIGHGTNVAGIIAASTNNEEGIAGVCWNVKLVSLKVGNVIGGMSAYALKRALIHAQSNKIPIVNMSIDTTDPDISLRTAIETYEGLIITVAGNDNYDLTNSNYRAYPAAYDYDHIIVVGASTINDEKWEDSNYGSTKVDLFAPGHNIYTTRAPYSENMKYEYVSGTSFAAPFVTGVAALIKANASYLYPTEIKEIIMNNVDQSYNFLNKCVSGGRLNAYKALSSIEHTHEYSYQYLNKNSHILTCRCGATSGLRQGHAISIDDVGKTYANCLGCGYLLNLNSDSAVIMGITSPSVIKVSLNGSYILSNQMIVLVDEDVRAYLNGTLVFYNKSGNLNTE